MDPTQFNFLSIPKGIHVTPWTASGTCFDLSQPSHPHCSLQKSKVHYDGSPTSQLQVQIKISSKDYVSYSHEADLLDAQEEKRLVYKQKPCTLLLSVRPPEVVSE